MTWSYVRSAVAFYVDFYKVLAESLVQFDLWLWARVQDAPSAVQAEVGKAGAAFGQFVDALFRAAWSVFNHTLGPLVQLVVDRYEAWRQELAERLLSLRTMTLEEFVRGLVWATFTSGLALAVLAVAVGVSVAEKVTYPMTAGVGTVVNLLVGAVTALLLSTVVVSVVGEWSGSTVIEELVPSWFDEVTGFAFGVGEAVLAYELAQRSLTPIRGVESALKNAIMGLIWLGVAGAIQMLAGDTTFAAVAVVIVDILALLQELVSLGDLTIGGRGANFVKHFYPLLYPVTLVVDAVGITTSASSLASDVNTLADRLGK